jgi:hypothetical protein
MTVKLVFGATVGLLTAAGLATVLAVGVPALAQAGGAASAHPTTTASSTPSSTPSATPSPQPSGPLFTCAIPGSQPVTKPCNDYPPGPRQNSCPPKVNPADPKEGPIPNQIPPDADVNGDGEVDWLLGQTTFFAPGPDKKDLVVQSWCMRAADPSHSYYSVRVYTSFRGKETLALPITKANPFAFCPFDGGKNSLVTFPNGTTLKSLPSNSPALTTVPARLDWISVNPSPDPTAKNANKFEGQKTIIWMLPNGEVVAGQISIPAGANLSPTDPAQVPADAFESAADTPDNMYVPLTGSQGRAVKAGQLTAAQKLALYQAATAEYKKLKARMAAAPPC